MHSRTLRPCIALLLTLATILTCKPSARANVYATNVRLNGGFGQISTNQAAPVTISYILNEPATAGVTIEVLLSNSVVRTIGIPAGNPGTHKGPNSVLWDGKLSGGAEPGAGTYRVRVTASALGFAGWTQITSDTDPGVYVWFGRGMAINQNASSPYYGRVFVGNASPGPGSAPGDLVGLLKLNADASPAEEGMWTTGNHNWAGDFFSPYKIEVSADDQVFVNDWNRTSKGEIFRWDQQLSTNSLKQVLRPDNWPAGADLSGPALRGHGTNSELWMADTAGGHGILRYKLLADGTCATNDTGLTVVGIGTAGQLQQSPADVALDSKGNIYTVQSTLTGADTLQRVFKFAAYDPSTNGGAPLLAPAWATGSQSPYLGGAAGIAVDPTDTYVAVSFLGVGFGDTFTNGNTSIFYATNGALVTRLDLGINLSGQLNHVDTDAAWDAAGNVYYIDNWYGVWRAFSPPGANQATTMALAAVEIIKVPPYVNSITVSGGVVKLRFTAGTMDTSSAFTILSSTSPAGTFSPASATISQLAPGVFEATLGVAGNVRFYRVVR